MAVNKLPKLLLSLFFIPSILIHTSKFILLLPQKDTPKVAKPKIKCDVVHIQIKMWTIVRCIIGTKCVFLHPKNQLTGTPKTLLHTHNGQNLIPTFWQHCCPTPQGTWHQPRNFCKSSLHRSSLHERHREWPS